MTNQWGDVMYNDGVVDGRVIKNSSPKFVASWINGAYTYIMGEKGRHEWVKKGFEWCV